MSYMPPSAAARERTRAIEQADHLLSAILKGLSPQHWAVLMLTPTVRDSDPKEQFAALTPVTLRLPGGMKGLLTSPSTRRRGVVAGTDVAATVLDYFGVDTPPGMVGRPMRIEPADAALSAVRTDYARQTDLEGLRRYVFRWQAVLAIIALWAAAGMLALGDSVPRWLRSLDRGLLLLVLSAPPALLLVALRPLSLLQMAGAAAALAVLIALVGAALTSWRSGHALPAIMLSGLLVYDLLRGERMLHWSPLSYSVASGARFYGIGDEYGGALLGSAIVGIAALLSQRRARHRRRPPAGCGRHGGLHAVRREPGSGVGMRRRLRRLHRLPLAGATAVGTRRPGAGADDRSGRRRHRRRHTAPRR
jgi:hypothetical protein